MKQPKPTKHNTSTLHQLCQLIPVGMVNELAIIHGVDKKVRTFSAWSHVVSLLFAQLTHAIGLNDVCDSLQHHSAKLAAIRGAVPPSRNGLSTANKERNSDMMEDLFWKVLAHLQNRAPLFAPSGRYKGLPKRFKKAIYAIDSSTIALVARCMDWAKHRRRKAAAKMHMKLNLNSFLPSFAIIEDAAHHDDARMGALTADLQEGEIAIFDKAYVHFENLYGLTKRGIFWVTRAKDNMAYRVCKNLIKTPKDNIIKDQEIILTNDKSRKQYPQRLRRVEADVMIDGKTVRMVFITNNFSWAASSVCDLYRSRWGIEVFFKQIKQTMKVCDFLGHSKQAIRWQLWSALLLYILLRFQSWSSNWSHSFTRLFTLIRGIVWDRFNLAEILAFYGTASGRWRMCSHPESAYLPGLSP